MSNGTLGEYVYSRNGKERIAVVITCTILVTTVFRQSAQMIGVDEGLGYLHSKNVIGGDLEG